MIYLSYPMLDREKMPDWAAKLMTTKRMLPPIYDPQLAMSQQRPDVWAALQSQTLSPTVRANAVALRLEPELLEPINDALLQRFRAADAELTHDIVFRHLYCLARSSIVLADLDRSAETVEATYAYLFGIPVIGVASRMVLSPWAVSKCNVVVYPRTVGDIVRQIRMHTEVADGADPI